MNTLFYVFFALVAVTANAQVTRNISIRNIVNLDQAEAYRGQVFHDGLLWEGNSTNGVANYLIDVYASDSSSVIASTAVGHTLEFIYPFGPKTVLVVGKHFDDNDGWRTYYSTVMFKDKKLNVITKALPEDIQVEQFGGKPGAMYFNETGMRKIFEWNGHAATFIKPDIHLPGNILVFDNYIYVLERNRLGPGDENVVKIELTSQTAARTFQQDRNFLSTLINLTESPWIATPESRANQVLLIDRESNRLAASLAVPGTPSDISQLGHCLVAVAWETKHLLFFDLKASGIPQIAEWDLTASGQSFRNLTTMHIDQSVGRIFLRAPMHPLVSGNIPGVKAFEEPSGETFRKCVGN